MHIGRQFFVLLSACLSISISAAQAQTTANGAGILTPTAASEPAVTTKDIHAASRGCRIFTPPLLEAGKAAWLTVCEASGRPAAGVSVFINDNIIQTDAMGQCSFIVPKADKVCIKIVGDDSHAIATVDYGTTAGGLLVADKTAKDSADLLESTIITNELAPTIAYAPALVQTGEPFVLIGKNLSGQADGDHIVLDGYDADVFAGSTVSLLATAPRRLEVGALRELYVTSGGETSNRLEVDVCKIDLHLAQDQTGKETAELRLIGTNMPALVQLRNSSADVHLSLAEKKLGGLSNLISPGTENNLIALAVEREPGVAFDIDAHIVADAPLNLSDATIFGDDNMRKIVCELNKAEIVRLRRRLIAVQSRTESEQQRRTKGLTDGTLDNAELDKLNNELRALSNREHRINSMIVSRRVLFQSLGGSDATYRAAMEDANSGAVFSLEKELAPITAAAMLASTTRSIPTAHATSEPSSEAQLKEAAQLEQSFAELSKQWQHFPVKVGHGTRLAPPPEPYLPDPMQLGDLAHAAEYSQIMHLHNIPPPPPVLKDLLSKSAHGAALKPSHSAVQRSRHSIKRHKHH